MTRRIASELENSKIPTRAMNTAHLARRISPLLAFCLAGALAPHCLAQVQPPPKASQEAAVWELETKRKQENGNSFRFRN